MLRENVLAPPARAPQYGLIAAAPVIDDGALPTGWAFTPEGCGNSGKLPILCAGNTTDMQIGNAEGTDWNGDVIEGDPIWIYAEDRCSSMGSRNRDWQGRARRQLTAVESAGRGGPAFPALRTSATPQSGQRAAASGRRGLQEWPQDRHTAEVTGSLMPPFKRRRGAGVKP